MAITYLGSLTIGEFMPVISGIHLEFLADLKARLAAQLELVLQLQFNPGKFTIAASLDFAFELVAMIQAQISLGIELPSISIQLDAAFAFILALEIQIGILLQLEFGTAGVHGYAFSGLTSQLGPELTAATAGGFPGGHPTDASNALILATSIPGVWAALGRILKTA